MALRVETAPTTEPVTRAELKAWLRLDTTDDDTTLAQSIAPGDHVVAAAYSLQGSGVDVSTSSATVFLNAGDCSAGEVDVKIQESDDDITYTDWTGGAFTQVTAANDNAVQEKAYTGTATYIRVVATVATGTCDFGVSILTQALTTDENDLLDSAIITARQWAEKFTNRSFLNTSWRLTFDDFSSDFRLPRSPASSITSIKYYDSNNAQQTLSSSYYDTDFDNEPGRVEEAYGYTWPTVYDRMNAVEVIFVAGYGAAASSVPDAIKTAIKMLAAHMYEHREAVVQLQRGGELAEVPLAVRSLLWMYRVPEVA